MKFFNSVLVMAAMTVLYACAAGVPTPSQEVISALSPIVPNEVAGKLQGDAAFTTLPALDSADGFSHARCAMVSAAMSPYFAVDALEERPKTLEGLGSSGFLLWWPMRGLMEIPRSAVVLIDGQSPTDQRTTWAAIRALLPDVPGYLVFGKTDTNSLYMFCTYPGPGETAAVKEWHVATGLTYSKEDSESLKIFPKLLQIRLAATIFWLETGRKPRSRADLSSLMGTERREAFDELTTTMVIEFLRRLKTPDEAVAQMRPQAGPGASRTVRQLFP